MKILKKMFIKNYSDTKSDNVRNRYGIVAGIFGIVTNLVLFVVKFITGILTGSMSIVADSVNSLSDMSSSAITVFGFKLSSKPADRHHPYGHHRIEYISSLMIALIMLMLGFMLVESSVSKIISNEPVKVNIVTFIILGFSVILKLLQMIIYIDFGKSINSETLVLSGKDSRNDIFTTIAVIISSLIIYIFGNLPFSIDGISGLLVAIFIIISSFMLLKETIGPLLGEKPDEKFLKEMRDFITSYAGVYGVHDLMVHNYGAKVNYAIAHVEVSGSADIMQTHKLIDTIERDFRIKFGGELTIHTDPIELDNKEINDLKLRIHKVLESVDMRLDFHDFRLVKCEPRNILQFDLVIPFDIDISKEMIINAIDKEINPGNKIYTFAIDFDRE